MYMYCNTSVVEFLCLSSLYLLGEWIHVQHSAYGSLSGSFGGIGEHLLSSLMYSHLVGELEPTNADLAVLVGS